MHLTSKTRRILVLAAVGYVIFWSGGSWSYWQTHDCVRSHTEERVSGAGAYEDTYEEEVCDYAVDNGKTWGFFSPVDHALGMVGL